MNIAVPRCLIILLLFVVLSPTLSAMELPLRFNWFSLNNVHYNKTQPNKELKWDEFYRAEIAIDSVKYQNLKLDIVLRSRAEFLTSYLELNKFNIVYNLSKMSFFAATRDVGYGKQNPFNPHSLIQPNFDRYLYQDTRFNGVGFILNNRTNRLQLSLGGNKQNQAITQLNSTWNLSPSNSIALCFEARAMDSFRRTPVFIGSISTEIQCKQVGLQTDLTTSYFPHSGRTKEHINSFVHLCLAISPFSMSSIYLDALALQSESINATQNSVNLSYSHRLNDFNVSPGVKYEKYGNLKSTSLFLLGEIWMNSEQRLGIIYRIEDSEVSNYCHYFGIQAVLRYGL